MRKYRLAGQSCLPGKENNFDSSDPSVQSFTFWIEFAEEDDADAIRTAKDEITTRRSKAALGRVVKATLKQEGRVVHNFPADDSET